MSDFFATLWNIACQAPLSSNISQSLLKFISIESVMLSNHLSLCCPLLLLPSVFPSISIFSNELTAASGGQNWSFSFNISLPNEYAMLLSFRIDWSPFNRRDSQEASLSHNGMITHLEPDILECEVKWDLGSITMNKATGSNGIPVELFQILKDDAVKVLHSICQQIWKTQQWLQDWKVSGFIPTKKTQCQRMFKLPHIHSSHTLAK